MEPIKLNEAIKKYINSKDFAEYQKILKRSMDIFGFSRGKAMEYIGKAAECDIHTEQELYYCIVDILLKEQESERK